MGRRSALLITGLVVAALGTLLVFLYTNNVQNTVSAEGELVEVYVASAPIKAGTPADQVSAELKAIPQGAVPVGAITDLATVEGQLAVVPIAAGQIALTTMFGQPAQVTTLAIAEGRMGVAVQLDDAQRVAGFVSPGSEVAVFATIQVGEVTETRMLLPRATVAAVGPTTVVSRTTGEGASANTEEIPTAILTLSLDQADAQKLIFAADQSRLYFALLTPQSVTAPGPGTSSSNLF